MTATDCSGRLGLVRRGDRRRRVDDRRRRVQPPGAPPPMPPGPGCSSVSSSPRSSRSATPPRRPSWPRCTRSRAAPTSTAGASSAPCWGHLAGWGFVVGKTASCAAIALTVGAYLLARARTGSSASPPWSARGRRQRRRPDPHRRRHQVPPRGGAGRARRRRGRRLVESGDRRSIGSPRSTARRPASCEPAGFLFFAFAGYARIATLGEEVRDPAPPSPRRSPAPWPACSSSTPSSASRCSPPSPVDAIAASDAPLDLVVAASPLDVAGRPSCASAPASPPSVSCSTSSPASPAPCWRWPGAASCPAGSPTSTTDAPSRCGRARRHRASSSCSPPRSTSAGAIGFSGVTILTYYAITNAAGLTLPPERRRWPRWIGVAGLVGCTVLAVMLPVAAIVAGVAVLVAGIAVRRITAARLGRVPSQDQ